MIGWLLIMPSTAASENDEWWLKTLRLEKGLAITWFNNIRLTGF
jgi:hypothetical protein